jgi:DNA-binding MarR family transcriptional regulator
MTNASFQAVLRLLRLHATLEARFSATLGSVHGLSLTDLLLLMNLERAPLRRLRRVDLANALAVSQSSVTRLAVPLEKIGLIGRESDVRDARVGYIVLTAAGITRVQEARATLDEMAKLVFADRWADDEVAQLSGLLGRLTTSLPGVLA